MLGLLTKRRLLSERQDALLDQVRVQLSGLRGALDRFGADVSPGDVHTVDETIAHLEELFLLVIAGEFNSGKSSFINALLGDKIVREGVTPTTDRITLLRHGPEPQERVVEEFLAEYTFPADILKQIVVVDTPGTNAIVRRHEELTREFIPRADLVLFVTSADRPFTESERAFLATIQEWGKKILVVLNKVDLLNPDEVIQVVSFIKENARDLLGFTPEVFPLSARLAQRGRQQNDPAAWQASRFEEFERYVIDQLDEEERVRLKLLSPIGVAQRIADKYLNVVELRLATLQEDVATLENIERQLELFREDLVNDFQYHLGDVDRTLNDLELRGNIFFDETLRLANIRQLIRTEEVSAAFEREVMGDVPNQIDSKLHSLIDWMIEKNLRLWQSIMDYLQRNRVPEHRHGLIGDVGGSFEYNRAALIDNVATTTRDVVEGYDARREAAELEEGVRNALAATALTEVGAVGLGALIVALVGSVAWDFTGILLAGVVGVTGLFIIPGKRAQIKRQFHEKITSLRAEIQETMQRQFDGELDKMMTRIREAIGPYTRFIRSQREQLIEAQRALSDVDVELGRVRAEIGK
ncbi:MAG: dynamin family protein [Roseiflexaceae bacterium]|nr:dynamin family protein [Roseiflexaceae bacterium]